MPRPTAPPLALLLFVLLAIPQIAFVGAVRAYPQGCSQSDFSYYDYDSLPLPPPFCSVKTTDDYLLTRRLGTGKFSDVFEALAVCSRDPTEPEEEHLLCVIKCLKPVTERKIRRELLVLHRCRDIPNLARLQAVVLPPHRSTPATTSTTCLVMEHAGRDAQWLCHPSSSNRKQEQHHQPQQPRRRTRLSFRLRDSLLSLSPVGCSGWLARGGNHAPRRQTAQRAHQSTTHHPKNEPELKEFTDNNNNITTTTHAD